MDRQATFVAANKVRLGSTGDEASLFPWFRDAQIVGIGEQTHGSDRNAELRMQLCQLLVRNARVGSIALEADYADVLPIDEFIQGGQGDIARLLSGQRAGWIWNKPAVRDFARWLRDDNLRRSPKERVHFVGIDMQTARAIGQAIVGRLAALSVEALVSLRPSLTDLRDCSDSRLNAKLQGQLESIASEYPTLSPLVRSLGQCIRLGAAVSEEYGQTRDRAMTDNVLALAGVEKSSIQARMTVVLAHNGHVARSHLGVAQETPMGAYLARGGGYVALGTVIGGGRFRAYRFDPVARRTSQESEIMALGSVLPGSLEELMADTVPFFLPLKTPTGAATWPRGTRPMRVIGASFAPGYDEHYMQPVEVGDAFDAILYLPES